MKTNLTIQASSSISAQGLASELKHLENLPVVYAVEPVYKELINPRKLRRMNKLVKMSHYSVLKILEQVGQSDQEKPAFKSIITTTGLGCLAETVKFLNTIESGSNSFLSPAAFINSTHNTPGGYLANAFNCNGYNTTHTQRDISFEMALMDAILLSEKELPVLVGGLDETEPNVEKILEYAKLINIEEGNPKSWKVPYSEGAGYFLLGTETENYSVVKLRSVEVIRKPITQLELSQKMNAISNNFKQKGLQNGLILSGNNGSSANKNNYDCLNAIQLPIFEFKKFIGEFASASAVALDLGCKLLKGELSIEAATQPDYAIFYNFTIDGYHSIMTISK